MRRSTTVPARALAVLCAAVFALAMFGTAAGAKTTKTTVKVAKVPGVGAVLVDTSGKTLYTLTDANGAAVACTDACLQAWPAAMTTAAKAKAPKGVKSLGVTADTNQITWKSLPLYTFAGDQGPKVANGEGIASFGGTWHVVKVGKTAASTTPTTAKPSSGGYSGY